MYTFGFLASSYPVRSFFHKWFCFARGPGPWQHRGPQATAYSLIGAMHCICIRHARHARHEQTIRAGRFLMYRGKWHHVTRVRKNINKKKMLCFYIQLYVDKYLVDVERVFVNHYLCCLQGWTDLYSLTISISTTNLLLLSGLFSPPSWEVNCSHMVAM